MDRRGSAPLLTIDEVADRLKVSRDTVDRWIKQGDLIARDLHAGRAKRRLLRVQEDDFEAFINRGVTPQRVERLHRIRPLKKYV